MRGICPSSRETDLAAPERDPDPGAHNTACATQTSSPRVASHALVAPLGAARYNVARMPSESATRNTLLISCLEAAREEAVRRLDERALPTSVAVERTIILDKEDGTGWQSGREMVPISPLQRTDVLLAIRDDPGFFRVLEFREQLWPLAEFLHTTTHLGDAQATGTLPEETGPPAIIGRHLCGLALQYVAGLDDVRQGSEVALQRASQDLALLCDPDVVYRTYQLVTAGATLAQPLAPYRNVTLRRLTPSERGTVLDVQ